MSVRGAKQRKAGWWARYKAKNAARSEKKHGGYFDVQASKPAGKVAGGRR